MFFRTKTFTNKDGSKRTYLYLAYTYREGAKVRQKNFLLGRLDRLLSKGKIDKLIRTLMSFEKERWMKKRRPFRRRMP